jgi:hypothetical protein
MFGLDVFDTSQVRYRSGWLAKGRKKSLCKGLLTFSHIVQFANTSPMSLDGRGAKTDLRKNIWKNLKLLLFTK